MLLLNKVRFNLGYILLTVFGSWSFNVSALDADVITIEDITAISDKQGASNQKKKENGISNPEVSALLRTEWAYSTVQDSSQKKELIFEPEVNLQFENDIKLTTIGRLRADIEDKLEPGAPSQEDVSSYSSRWLIGDHADLELREFYFESDVGQSYFIIGKQQVVWGKADGLKVLDVVNPQDFREFILDDFDDSRIPLWTMNAEIPIGDSVLQLLWIPDQTYNTLPEFGSLYAFTSPSLVPSAPAGTLVNMRPVDKPERFFEDADYGARLTSFIGGWDVTLNYLYHYNDTPVMFRIITTDSQPTVTITPRYERTHLLGGTFSNAFGDFVLRGEVGYSSDRYFISNNSTDSDGIIKSDELAYVFGLDWSGIDETFISMQLFQSHVLDEQPGLIRDKANTTVTFLARREFMNDTLVAEVLLLHNVSSDDGLMRPKLSYEWLDNLNVWLGLDVFYGDKNGLFGQFDENDRVIIGMEWSL